MEKRFYLVGEVRCCCPNGRKTAFYQRGLLKAGGGGDAVSAGLLMADGTPPQGRVSGGSGRGAEAKAEKLLAQGDSCCCWRTSD